MSPIDDINGSRLRAAATAGTRAASGPGTGLPEGRDPKTPKEAAQEFEKVLVRQFVEVMTKDMFSSSLAGEGGGGWMKSQRGNQRDMMTDMLTDRIVESGSLQISEQLTKQWSGSGASGTPSNSGMPLRQRVDPLPSSSPASSSPNTPASDEGPRFDRAA